MRDAHAAVRVAGLVGRVERPPDRPVLIFDGSCGFCRTWVSRARRLDRRGIVRYMPLQDPEAPRTAGRDREALEQAVHLVRPDGYVFAGAAAAREFLRYVPGGGIASGVAALPGVMPLAERVYRAIARRWGPLG